MTAGSMFGLASKSKARSEVGELGADGGQAEHPAGLVDGGVGGLFGQPMAGPRGHELEVP